MAQHETTQLVVEDLDGSGRPSGKRSNKSVVVVGNDRESQGFNVLGGDLSRDSNASQQDRRLKSVIEQSPMLRAAAGSLFANSQIADSDDMMRVYGHLMGMGKNSMQGAALEQDMRRMMATGAAMGRSPTDGMMAGADNDLSLIHISEPTRPY